MSNVPKRQLELTDTERKEIDDLKKSNKIQKRNPTGNVSLLYKDLKEWLTNISKALRELSKVFFSANDLDEITIYNEVIINIEKEIKDKKNDEFCTVSLESLEELADQIFTTFGEIIYD
jgi:hypothetical protein